MKKFFSIATTFAMFFASTLISSDDVALSDESNSGAEDLKKDLCVEHDMCTISKAFGHIIKRQVESIGLDFDMSDVIKGMQEAIEGKPSPLSEGECVKAISQIQEKVFHKQSKENLAKAEEFLKNNKLVDGVVEIEPGKLQYMELVKGSGDEVQQNFSPKIRYQGKFLDGTTFGESKDDEIISLNDTIKGFSQAVVGMQQNGKRRIFIHPEYGYGDSVTPGLFPPNSLLTFDIEVVEINTQKDDQRPALSQSGDVKEFDNQCAMESSATIDTPESIVK